MRTETTPRFDREYTRLPQHIQARVDKQFALLLSDPRHPSLRIRKMKGWRDIWEGHVTQNCCFTFNIVGDIYIFRRIGTHNIYRKP